MTITEIYCTECGRVVDDQEPYCPSCGEERPWNERPAYRLKDDSFPFVFPIRFLNDNYQLWDAFCREYWGRDGLTGDEIGELPDDFPKMKYTDEIEIWYGITENYELRGPCWTEKDMWNEVRLSVVR